MNYLANALPLGGVTTGEVANQYDNLILPAGYVFSIWGLIYLWLAVFVVWQLKRGGIRDIVRNKISWFFMISALFNVLWLLAWHTAGTSVALKVMILYIITVALIYLRLSGDWRKDRNAVMIAVVPFSILLAWLSFALVANITAFLLDVGWDRYGLSEGTWATIIILMTLALAQAFLWIRKDVFASLVFVWAWTGIIARQTGTIPDLLKWILLAAIAMTLATAMFVWLRKGLREQYFGGKQ